MWKIYRGPSIGVRHRKGTYWSVSLVVAAVVAVAALLILGLSDGRGSGANHEEPSRGWSWGHSQLHQHGR
jgi:hypothetical protein